MRAINHALTGAVIGLAVGEPVVAIPAALASHFVCDAIPHHGNKRNVEAHLRNPGFRNALYGDALLCLVLVAVLAVARPLNWQLASVCAFIAAAPDFLSFKRYLAALKRRKYRFGAYTKFARDIQWFERPIGIVVEVAWFIAGVALLAPFVTS